MSDYKPFPGSNSRQLIDYNRFMELTGDKVFLCLDRGVIAIAQYLLNTRGLWRSTYVKEYVGTVGYIMPTEAEFENITEAIAEANIDMASCNDIVEAINGVKDAISAGGVSGGSSGCGCIGEGSTDITELSDSPSEDIPPAEDWEELGFASEEAYTNHKCLAANYILRGYIGTLRNWGGLFGTVGGLTLTVITALLLITVPPAGLMIVVTALGVLAGIDIGLLANFTTIASDIEDDIDAILCEMYNASTTEDAANALRNAVDDIVIALGLGLVEGTFLTITQNLASNVIFEDMFKPGSPESSEGDPNCTSCGCDPVTSGLTIQDGNLISSGGGEYVLEGVFVDGYGCGSSARQVAIYRIPDGFQITEFEIVSGTPTNCSGSDIYFAFEGLGSPFSGTSSSGNAGFSLPQSLGSLYILSASDFTARFKLCEIPE